MTCNPSIAILCHYPSSPILINVMWFYKVARGRALLIGKLLNSNARLTAWRSPTAHPGPDPWLAFGLNASKLWGPMPFLRSSSWWVYFSAFIPLILFRCKYEKTVREVNRKWYLQRDVNVEHWNHHHRHTHTHTLCNVIYVNKQKQLFYSICTMQWTLYV